MIGKNGYGRRRRRRRSVEETPQPNLQSGEQTQCNKDGQQDSRHKTHA